MKGNVNNKTAELRNLIFREILSGTYQVGEKLPAEREMAERYSLSRVTVRRAYENLEQSGIVIRKQGLGTCVADFCRANSYSGNIIGLLINGADRFAWDFIREIETQVRLLGGLLVLRLTDDDAQLEESAAIDLVGQGIQNLIIWASGKDFKSETFERLRVLGTNMVFFDRMIPGDYADYVGVDNNDIMEKLFDKAPKNIEKALFLNHRIPFDSDKLREKYFVRQCGNRGIAPTVKRIDYAELKNINYQEFDAVFCVNDDMAMQVYELDSEIMIFGIDGLCHKFVSYRQPMKMMAERIIELLNRQRLSGDKWKSRKIFEKGEICEKVQ